MLKPGDTFERYTVEAAIGQGGMGCVYRAHDARLGRRVALKVISDGAAGAEAPRRADRRSGGAAQAPLTQTPCAGAHGGPVTIAASAHDCRASPFG